jgi:serine/threonine protein phosphatase PrpC
MTQESRRGTLRIVEEAVRSDTGRQRRGNEDSYYARMPLYVIADGMGGAQSGEVASRIATEVFDEDLENGSPEEQLAARAREANRRIYELAREDVSHSGMGTTLTGAFVYGDEVAIVHVGDSRAYLFRDGELRRITRDHSLVEELRRRGQLTNEQASEHPQRSVITRALGPEPDVEVDVHTHQVRSGDVFLLCTDGLTDMVSEDDLRAALIDTPTLEAAVDRLIEEANAAGGRDNITVIAFRIDGDELSSPAPDETVLNVRPPTALAPAPSTVEAPPPPAPAPARSRRRRRPGVRAIAVTLLAIAVLGAAVYGALAGLHSVYFVGSQDGLVTLYRGLPYELPFGIDLYQERYVSSVPVQALDATERRRVLDHQLRSRGDAASVVRRLEQGRGP